MNSPGSLFTKRRRLTGLGVPNINLTRSNDRLEFIMGTFTILRRLRLNE